MPPPNQPPSHTWLGLCFIVINVKLSQKNRPLGRAAFRRPDPRAALTWEGGALFSDFIVGTSPQTVAVCLGSSQERMGCASQLAWRWGPCSRARGIGATAGTYWAPKRREVSRLRFGLSRARAPGSAAAGRLLRRNDCAEISVCSDRAPRAQTDWGNGHPQPTKADVRLNPGELEHIGIAWH